MNDTNNNALPNGLTPQPSAPQQAAVKPPAGEWKGLTIDELRQRRAKSLVKREVGRVRLMQQFQQKRHSINENGLRGMLFNNNLVGGLKTADYILLGLKAAKLVYRLSKRRRR